MDFDKVLRKQTLHYRIFLLAMGFIFLFNPIALIITEANQIQYLVLLAIIEILIIVAVLVKYKTLYLKFSSSMDIIKIVSSFPRKKALVLYDNVLGITVTNTGSDMKIIIITKVFRRGTKFKYINIDRLKKDTSFYDLVNKIVTLKKQEKLQYIIISCGGVKKYELLDILYQRCTKAFFTSNAILEIKKYRE